MRENESIAPVLDRLELVSHLQQIFAEATPAGVSAVSRIASIEGTTLVVVAANGAAATRLKQLQPQLLAKLQEKREVEVTAIRILVQPEAGPYEPSGKASKSVAPKPAMPLEVIDSLTENIEDSPLKSALQQIKKRRERALTSRRKNP